MTDQFDVSDLYKNFFSDTQTDEFKCGLYTAFYVPLINPNKTATTVLIWTVKFSCDFSDCTIGWAA